ncbi:hypothetical protein EJ02DRAFT_52617 [Clathrospora elynae]|uniref:Uncharacterized protein n=1 Tax=Clathrospora elynae TaxID=706981 RepID=A0A6A5SXC3_9PLEO|nr:hypothetical protein EJ02DRAFT_52617 [Clathrospora elynae]
MTRNDDGRYIMADEADRLWELLRRHFISLWRQFVFAVLDLVFFYCIFYDTRGPPKLVGHMYSSCPIMLLWSYSVHIQSFNLQLKVLVSFLCCVEGVLIITTTSCTNCGFLQSTVLFAYFPDSRQQSWNC